MSLKILGKGNYRRLKCDLWVFGCFVLFLLLGWYWIPRLKCFCCVELFYLKFWWEIIWSGVQWLKIGWCWEIRGYCDPVCHDRLSWLPNWVYPFERREFKFCYKSAPNGGKLIIILVTQMQFQSQCSLRTSNTSYSPPLSPSTLSRSS